MIGYNTKDSAMRNEIIRLHRRIARLERIAGTTKSAGGVKELLMDSVAKNKNKLIKAWGGNPNDIDLELWFQSLDGGDVYGALRDAPNREVAKIIKNDIIKPIEDDSMDEDVPF